MTCDHCVKSVSDALYNLDGITKVDVSLEDQLVTVEGTGKLGPFCFSPFPFPPNHRRASPTADVKPCAEAV